MKKLLMVAAILTIVLSAVSLANAEETQPKSVDTILAEIQQAQGVSSSDQIDPDKVSQTKLEELGDSVMEAMIGNSETHEQMDDRLGGDGSASLSAFHTRLGYNYLVGYPNGMMSLMTSGMMGNADGTYNWNGMMGYNSFRNSGMMGYIGWGGMLIGLLGLVLLIAVLYFVIRALGRKPKNPSIESPLDILKKRFAAGEITHEEYEKMVDFLKK